MQLQFDELQNALDLVGFESEVQVIYMDNNIIMIIAIKLHIKSMVYRPDNIYSYFQYH